MPEQDWYPQFTLTQIRLFWLVVGACFYALTGLSGYDTEATGNTSQFPLTGGYQWDQIVVATVLLLLALGDYWWHRPIVRLAALREFEQLIAERARSLRRISIDDLRSMADGEPEQTIVRGRTADIWVLTDYVPGRGLLVGVVGELRLRHVPWLHDDVVDGFCVKDDGTYWTLHDAELDRLR